MVTKSVWLPTFLKYVKQKKESHSALEQHKGELIDIFLS